jgi:hypothetical protein
MVVAAERLAITRTKTDISTGLPAGKMIKADSPQSTPETRARIK